MEDLAAKNIACIVAKSGHSICKGFLAFATYLNNQTPSSIDIVNTHLLETVPI